MRALLALALAIVITLTASPVEADEWEYDAGTGDDAPGSAAYALPVGWGSFTGFVWKNDVDWYAAPDVGSISCVEYAVTGVKGVATLVADGASASAPFNRSTANIALAVQDPSSVRTSVQGPSRWSDAGEYTVDLARVTGGGPEPGGDAGNAVATATPVSDGCVGGTTSLVDPDYYSFSVPDGADITVSAASLGGVSFSVRSPAGDVLATLAPGDVITLAGLSSGSYTMSASSMSMENPAYVLAVILPPPCRPDC